jgi:hypothetical protein
MEENPLSDEILPDLSPQLIEVAEKEVALYKATQLASTTARTGFHEKLVVITAGSLTIVATMATNIYIKPLAEKLLNQRLLDALAISSVLFFLSLIASVIHNFAETKSLHFDYLAAGSRMGRKLFQAIVKESKVGELDAESANVARKIVHSVDDHFAKEEAGKFQKAERYRTFEHWITLLAVIFFILGYMPVIGFVIYLAHG